MEGRTLRAENLTHPPIVLLVEDDESSREMYSMFLESAGFWVLGARDGAEGLISARNYRPQVVVTDVSMPVMDGWELAQALRQDESTADIHIIAVSGRSREEADLHLRQHHVDTVLEKPCLPDELLSAIREVLARASLARVRSGGHLAKVDRLRARSAEPLERSQKHQRRRK